MQLYSFKNPSAPLGRVIFHRGIPAPLGAVMPNSLLTAFSDIIEDNGLKQVALVTPWAQRESDAGWTKLTKAPETNVAIFDINDAKVNAIEEATGQPLPFLAVLTAIPQSTEQVRKALLDTAYDYYETQAVYRQDDTRPVPEILYLHWALRRSQGSDKGGKSMASAAGDMGGKLFFAQQVPYTAQREFPSLDFDTAINLQLSQQNASQEAPIVVVDTTNPTAPVPVVTAAPEPAVPATQQLPPQLSVPITTPPAQTPKASASMPWLGPALVGVGVATAVVLLSKGLKK